MLKQIEKRFPNLYTVILAAAFVIKRVSKIAGIAGRAFGLGKRLRGNFIQHELDKQERSRRRRAASKNR